MHLPFTGKCQRGALGFECATPPLFAVSCLWRASSAFSATAKIIAGGFPSK